MMNIAMEQIDEMRKRTNCSYQEAKELLEKHNGDLIEAIIDFENKHGSQARNTTCDKKTKCGKKFKELVHKGFLTRIIIEKEENVIINIPVNILILAVLITMPVFWIYPIAFIVIYLLGFKIRIRKEKGQEVDINEFVDGLGSKVKTATERMYEKDAEKSSDKKDDYNEITIE